MLQNQRVIQDKLPDCALDIGAKQTEDSEAGNSRRMYYMWFIRRPTPLRMSAYRVAPDV